MPFQDWFTDEPLFWQTLTNILKTGNRGPAIKGEWKFNSPRTADTQNFSIPYPIEFPFLGVLWFCRFRINCSCFASRRIWILETLSFELCLEVGYARDLVIYANGDLSVQIWIIRTPPWDLTSSMSSLQANSGSFCFLDCFVLRSLFWFFCFTLLLYHCLSLGYRYRSDTVCFADWMHWMTCIAGQQKWTGCECVIALWNTNGRLLVRAILEEKDSAWRAQWIKYKGGTIIIDRWIVKELTLWKSAWHPLNIYSYVRRFHA
jgi:hypothetical protein